MLFLSLINSSFFLLYVGRRDNRVNALDKEYYMPIFYINQEGDVKVIRVSEDSGEDLQEEESDQDSTADGVVSFRRTAPPVTEQSPSKDTKSAPEPTPEPDPNPNPDPDPTDSGDNPVDGGPDPFGDDIGGFGT